MQVTVENTGALERKMTIQYPWDEVETRESDALKKLQKKAKIDGFRPGKAPMTVIKKYHGDRVRYDVISDIMRHSYFEAIQKEDLSPAGYPFFDPKEIKEGEDFEFIATFEVFPEFEVVELDGQTIEREVAELKDSDIDATIEKLRKQMQSFEKVDRACDNADEVTIHFEGFVDGDAFEGGKAENFKIVLGSNRMIPGFESAIIGMNAGEDKTIDVEFPKEYHSEALAGKPAQFKIHMVEVAGAVLPEVDAEFIKRYGVEDGDINKFKDELRNELQRELDITLKTKLKKAVFDKTLELNSFEVPKALIDNEIKQMQDAQVKQMQQYGLKDSKIPAAELFEEEAKKRVALGIIVDKLIKKYDVKPDADKVKTLIEQRASVYDQPEEIVNAFYANEKLLNEMQDIALEEQIVETLIKSATLKEVEKSFADLMGQQ
ncbi:MAG: trigger factor [Legionellales bacterium]|nr:trigger factor [Legionellales bacterium]